MKPTTTVSSRTDPFVTPVAVARDDSPNPSAFWGMASICWLASVFILYSRFFDLVLKGLYIPRVVISLMLLFFAISGRPLVFLRSGVGKIMLVFLSWASFTLIFSVWKGGSLPFYFELLISLLFFAVAASLPNTISNAKKSHYALAFSGLLAALMSIPLGADLNGRLALRDGSYADPNYYALGLLAIVPFFWEMAASTKSNAVKAFAWLSLVPICWALIKTGSRGAMFGLVAMLLVLLVISPLKKKIVLVLVCAIGLATVIVTVPDYLRARYFTIFSLDSGHAKGDSSDLDRLRSDINSSEGRKLLLMESIALTLEHPLVGVGLGNFQAAVYDEAKAKGIVHNEWMATHNSYTQISCETGLPGLFLVLCLIGVSFNNVRCVLKGAAPAGDKPDIAAYAAAKSLLLSLAVVCTCAFFLAVGYEFTIYLWAGLTVSLRRVYEQSKVTAALPESETRDLANSQPVFAPVYAKIKDRSTQPPMPRDPARSVRFNRFR